MFSTNNNIHNCCENNQGKDDFLLQIEEELIIDSPNNNELLVDSDLCDLSDDWTPVERIQLKKKRLFFARMCIYFIWCSMMSAVVYIFYIITNELYHE